MNRAERLSAVLDLLAEDGQVEVDQIVDRLDVSPATARRDLDALAQQQLLTRTRGGAVAHSVAYDLPIRYKNQQNPDRQGGDRPGGERAGAARRRDRPLRRHDATAIADALMSRADIMEPSPDPSLTVVTNAINIAMQLAMRPQIKTVVTGGVVHARSYELVGAYADAVLGSITLDLAFIGVNGIDPVVGPTSHDEREAAVNALMASRATHAVLVADASKIDKRAFAAIGHRRLFSTIITDAGATLEQRATPHRRAGTTLSLPSEHPTTVIHSARLVSGRDTVTDAWVRFDGDRVAARGHRRRRGATSCPQTRR